MIDVAVSLIMFLIVVTIHLLLCRQFKGLRLGLFLILAFVGLWVLWMSFDFVNLIPSEYFFQNTAKVMYLVLLPLYWFFYSSVNYISPSKRIQQVLKKDALVGYDQLLSVINDEKYIEHALEKLVKHGFLYKRNDRFLLTFKGKILIFSGKLDKKVFKG
jgi:hypothetical protein